MLSIGVGIGVGYGGAAAFTPASLFAASEVGVWYDPSDLSTLWKDTAGTDPVTADGDAVARIDDKSGNGKHATQATLGNRPLYKTSAGLHWLEFDGTDDALVTSAIDLTATAQAALVTGIRIDAETATFQMIAELSADGGSNNGAFVHYINPVAGANNDEILWGLRGTTATSRRVAQTYPLLVVSSCLYDISQAARDDEIKPRLDGVEPTTLAPVATAGTGNFGNHVLNIGRRNQTSLPMDGRNYGFVLIDRTLTADELSSAESYMAAKQGRSI